MQNNFRTMFIVTCALVLPSMTFAKVEVPSIFGDNMILQRELLVPIWGTASAGEKVLVSFDNRTVETTADNQGKWMVKLKPLEASITERKLTIKGSNTITFEGVLVGEAWLCSGQSNMADSLNKNITEPAYVRYLFSKPEPNAEISLINAEGLPASSFMTDDFMPPRQIHAPEREAGGRATDVIESDIVPAFVDTASADTQPTGLIAEGHDSRIDLIWDRVSDTDQDLFNIYRAEQADGPWQKLNMQPHTIHVYSDFIGKNGRTYHYRVTRWIDDETDFSRYRARRRSRSDKQVRGTESAPSDSASATTREMNDEEFLDSMQKACLRYFWDFGHPVSGLAREGLFHRRFVTTTGGTGFGMVTIMVGADRGFITRKQAAERLLKMVTFLEEKAERYHGLWSHHLRGDSGQTIPFAGKQDNGGDIVESAFLMEGMLTIREYFDQDDPVENELRERITRLWEQAEWSWHLQSGDKMLTWHWSKEYGFAKNHKFRGFNECMIAYLLAMASPTHSIPADCYYLGWAGNASRYVNGRTYYDIKQPVGNPLGGPLFFTHYSFIGLDPHQLTDAYTNYYDNNRAISLIQHRYAIDNPNNHQGYGKLVWGLTASQNPRGYKAHAPGANSNRDDGTIAPTAAISALPYTPDESMAALKHFYHEMGSRIWGPFGFRDAFNLGADWVSPSYLAIDQGPMVPMIENHRTGLVWKMFMKSNVAKAILEKLAEARPAARQP